MSIKIYDTYRKEKIEFVPQIEGEVKMYVCGPTVYGLLHVGNFRGPVVFNLVRNWLEKRGYNVTYVYNFTDVDDKIIDRANQEKVTSNEISERYIEEFKKDFSNLGLKPHSHNPKVTQFIPDIVKFIDELMLNKKAYLLDDGVYFSVGDFSEYGKLSNKNIEELKSGHRIDIDKTKRHDADFALWKLSKPGEPSWPSPWGEGRPGWHIECSTMSRCLLGDTLDIHGGGLDLVFPHHENEIAQSEGCTGHKYVNYWMHNNMINFGDQKMSKSLGNIRTGRSFFEEYDGEIYKFLILQAHYRSVIDFSVEQIDRAIHSLARFYSAMALAQNILRKQSDTSLVPVPGNFISLLDKATHEIEISLDDDFNTPEMMARLFEVLKSFNNYCRKPGKITSEMVAISETFIGWIKKWGEVLALFQLDPEQYLFSLDNRLLQKKNLSRNQVDELIQKRADARSKKDFKVADEVRDQLQQWGIAVQDGLDGTHWEVAK